MSVNVAGPLPSSSSQREGVRGASRQEVLDNHRAFAKGAGRGKSGVLGRHGLRKLLAMLKPKRQCHKDKDAKGRCIAHHIDWNQRP